MMAVTMIPIQSVTLTASAASVTFSGIPQTYTDLVLRMSVRTTDNLVDSVIQVKVNSSTSGYSYTDLRGDGSTASSTRFGFSGFVSGHETASQATANTFGSSELMIPNYSITGAKVASGFGVSESNQTAARMSVVANLLTVTDAVTTLTASSTGSGSLVAGSTFHLYGIKKD